MANRRPEISYYTTDAFLIPGALEFRSFKTTTTLAAAAAVQQTLLARGEYERDILPQIQPITVTQRSTVNPWISYSIYLNNTFLPGVLGVIILLTTIFSIGSEIKHATSREWLRTADDNILLAVTGKLLPQTLLFFIMGALCQSLFYGYFHFPLQKRHLAHAGGHVAFCHGPARGEHILRVCRSLSAHRPEHGRTLRCGIVLTGRHLLPGRSQRSARLSCSPTFCRCGITSSSMPTRRSTVFLSITAVCTIWPSLFMHCWLCPFCHCSNGHCADKSTWPDF